MTEGAQLLTIQGAISPTGISPWYVQFAMSSVDIIESVLMHSYVLFVFTGDSSYCWWSFVP